MLCGDPEGWDGGTVGGRSKREGIYVYIWLIHFVVQQKLTQHCKATILQKKRRGSSWSLYTRRWKYVQSYKHKPMCLLYNANYTNEEK